MSPDNRNTRFNDVKLFLWLIPTINIINYYLTYIHFGPFWRIAATFTLDTLQGYIAWLLIRTLIRWLDKRISYEENTTKRIVIQLILTLVAGSGTIILLTELANWIATSKPVPASFYRTDIFIISIWIFVVNGIYIGLHYYWQWQASEQKRKEEAAIKSGGFKVSASKKDLLFSFEEIGGFYIDGDYSVVVTMEKKKFFVDSSLDKVEQTLPGSYFFRLNRQYIVHRQLVAGYEKSDNGKINVLLKEIDHFPSTIPVSRTKAPIFKSWVLPS
jgi:LytTr DNA-binding domain